jgi:DNA-nicking Smr family endonuclease
LIKKISDQDKKDWKKFLDSKEKLENKDKSYSNSKKIDVFTEKTIDLHGYTLEEANKKIYEFIENSYLIGINKINIITGKGLRSKNLDDPYKSKNLSILKYSVPNFIKNNSDLMNKILEIDFDAVNSSSKGNFDIILKTKKNEIK